MTNVETFRAERIELPQLPAGIVNAVAPFIAGVGAMLILTTTLHAFEGRSAIAASKPPVFMAAVAVSDSAQPSALPTTHQIALAAPVADERSDLPDSAASAPAEIEPAAAERIQPSFPCAAVRNRNLKLICATPSLAQADQDLAEAYRIVLDKSPAPDTLREAQLEWVRQRNAAPAGVDALLAMYQDRTNQLHALESLPSVN